MGEGHSSHPLCLFASLLLLYCLHHLLYGCNYSTNASTWQIQLGNCAEYT